MTDTLLMLSGGIDSAYCLYTLVSQGKRVRTHHVYLDDHEGRVDVEGQAVNKVLEWMGREGYSDLITHTSSHVSFGLPWIPKNYHLWAYWAGAIMSSPQGRQLNKYVLPRHSDAFTNAAAAQKSTDSISSHIKLMSGKDIEFVMPMAHMTKAEVVQAIPQSLLECCWWCRTPQNGKPCHRCRTCKQVDPALAKIKSA